MINIYVGNLPYSVDSNELREAFEPYGEVGSVEVIFDRRTKRSRGYGFVEMSDDDAAREAIAALNGSDYQGRELRVDESQAKDPNASRGNGAAKSRRRQSAENDDRAPSPAETSTAGGGLMGFVKKLFG